MLPPFSVEARSFIDHWIVLRGETKQVATLRAFLDRVNPELQPFVSFNDVNDDGSDVISLYAAGLADMWGRDLTGLAMADFLAPDIVVRMRADLSTAARQPCGLWEVASFTTSGKRRVTAEIVTLPLAVERPGVMRLARFHRQIDKLAAVEHVTGVVMSLDKRWFDIGAGLPARPPTLASAASGGPKA